MLNKDEKGFFINILQLIWCITPKFQITIIVNEQNKE